MKSNAKAKAVIRNRRYLSETDFVEMAVWSVPTPVRGSAHGFKYRLAYVEGDRCRVRFDNEAGKGDHLHLDDREVPYLFRDLETLLDDFEAEVSRWRRARTRP